MVLRDPRRWLCLRGAFSNILGTDLFCTLSSGSYPSLCSHQLKEYKGQKQQTPKPNIYQIFPLHCVKITAISSFNIFSFPLNSCSFKGFACLKHQDTHHCDCKFLFITPAQLHVKSPCLPSPPKSAGNIILFLIH